MTLYVHLRSLEDLIAWEALKTLSLEKPWRPYHMRSLQDLITWEAFKALSHGKPSRPHHMRSLQDLITWEAFKALSHEKPWRPITWEAFKTLSHEKPSRPYHMRSLQDLITWEAYKTLDGQTICYIAFSTPCSLFYSYYCCSLTVPVCVSVYLSPGTKLCQTPSCLWKLLETWKAVMIFA